MSGNQNCDDQSPYYQVMVCGYPDEDGAIATEVEHVIAATEYTRQSQASSAAEPVASELPATGAPVSVLLLAAVGLAGLGRRLVAITRR